MLFIGDSLCWVYSSEPADRPGDFPGGAFASGEVYPGRLLTIGSPGASSLSQFTQLVPILDLLPRPILGQAIALLEFPFELLSSAIDDIQIVISEIAPLLLDLPLQLLPVSFDSIQSMAFLLD